jgi:LuxR family transcriptional regulator, positive regulator of biofilm formation
MNILIDLSNYLVAEGINHLLVSNSYSNVMVSGKSLPDNFLPDVILVDINTINQSVFSRYPGAKVLLIDTGIEKERIITTLLSYKIHGVLSTTTEFSLFEKALNVVHQGEVWIDNNTVKAFLHHGGLSPDPSKIGGVTDREKEIIECVCHGYTNKEIADRLSLSEHTVKAHLNRIFRKFNATSRSRLITLVMNNQAAKTE